MNLPTLKTVTRAQGNNSALLGGEVVTDGFKLEFEEIPVLVHAFRRMVRGLEFDVCEMALTTYLCAREHGVKFTALPIFLVRGFHHGAILHNTRRPVRDMKALEGQKVGVNRGYTVTTGVWARSILQEEFGVNLANISWARSGDEHVESYQAPANVSSLDDEQSIEDRLLSMKLAAAINIAPNPPDIQSIIENPLEAGLAAFQARGHYPINHLIVVRDEVLNAWPDAALAVFNAFAASKRLYMQKLEQGKIEKPDAADLLHQRILQLGHDPLPYGIEPNRKVLEELIGHALTQEILKNPVKLESLFAPSTHGINA